MSRKRIMRISELYCTQPSVGMAELAKGGPAAYLRATDEEILAMSRRHPIPVVEEYLARGTVTAIEDGHHRGYNIRFLSANPNPDTRVWVKPKENQKYPVELLESIVRRGQTVEALELRP